MVIVVYCTLDSSSIIFSSLSQAEKWLLSEYTLHEKVANWPVIHDVHVHVHVHVNYICRCIHVHIHLYVHVHCKWWANTKYFARNKLWQISKIIHVIIWILAVLLFPQNMPNVNEIHSPEMSQSVKKCSDCIGMTLLLFGSNQS